MLCACGLNILLDILCVRYLHMGVAGAALATILSQALSAVLSIVTLLRQKDPDTRLSLGSLRLEAGLMKRILMVGIPAGLQFVTFDLANLLIQSGINSFGDVTVAAWTAYTKPMP